MVKSDDWYHTPTGEARGYIVSEGLKELWFHMGTRCNLSCSFCLEGSSPGDKRLQSPKLGDIQPYIDQAVALGVEQFSFTGGEPFLAKDFIDIVNLASQYKPCLILTNGSEPLLKRLAHFAPLAHNPYPVSLRLSIDSIEPNIHDSERGDGNFRQVLTNLKKLVQLGFSVSVARHMSTDEDSHLVDEQYRDLFALNGLPRELNIVAFPDFLTPDSLPDVPQVTEHCMTTYQTEQSRAQFMCASSRMMVKAAGKMDIYACTLVDDDDEYNLGSDLAMSLKQRISMKHHRCYSCFAYGSSCSERG